MENIAGKTGPDAELLLEVRNLCAWYGKDKMVLSDLTLDLRKNEVVGLIGLNGAGKTTLIKTLAGLHETFRAEDICFGGKPVSFRDAHFKQERYIVFAEDDSFQYFTFREYLAYVLSAYHKGRAADAAALVRGFHFEEYTDTLIRDLSTGNRKKVFLIAAFTLRPQLLLLDEPVNGLDLQSTEFLYRLISGYKGYGTLLFSSHILESIEMTCDRVVILENGQTGRVSGRERMDAAAVREMLWGEEETGEFSGSDCVEDDRR